MYLYFTYLFFSLSKRKENLTELHIIVRTTGYGIVFDLEIAVKTIKLYQAQLLFCEMLPSKYYHAITKCPRRPFNA